jgi:hypothetical protein
MSLPPADLDVQVPQPEKAAEKLKLSTIRQVALRAPLKKLMT